MIQWSAGTRVKPGSGGKVAAAGGTMVTEYCIDAAVATLARIGGSHVFVLYSCCVAMKLCEYMNQKQQIITKKSNATVVIALMLTQHRRPGTVRETI